MQPCKAETFDDLAARALQVKKGIVELAAFAGEGHCASALSIADIVTALYFHRMHVDPQDPEWPGRDRFVLSKGHACQTLYVALHLAGFFDTEKLHTFLQTDTGLAGHPVRGGAPGVEASTGSLGHGLSVSVGLALGAKMQKKDYHTFAVIGDGESNEGIVWEAALASAHYRLDNLTVVLDRNNYQCDGFSDNVMRINPVDKKWESFGWSVHNCDGHDLRILTELLDAVPFEPGKPSIIVARTIKGKGVSFMENSAEWHYRAPSPDELKAAIDDLEGSCGY